MLVKNPTEGEIVYSFASLTLTAGATSEIDNSFIENVDFQTALNAGNIAIMNYEKNTQEYTQTLKVNESSNTPSNDQKGGMVAANNPSVLNPFTTTVDNVVYGLKLYYSDGDTLAIRAVGSKKVLIDTELKTVIESTLAINSNTKKYDVTGAEDGTVEESTLYNVYYKKSDGALRLSSVNPSFSENAKYLNSNRDLLFIGWVYIDSSFDVEDVVSYYNMSTLKKVKSLTGTVAAVVDTATEVYNRKVIIPPFSAVQANIIIPVTSTVGSEEVELAINDTPIVQSRFDSIENKIYYAPIVVRIDNFTTGAVTSDIIVQIDAPSINHTVDTSKIIEGLILGGI